MDDEMKDRFKHPEYPHFREWFSATLRGTNSCFERDVLRDCHLHLWKAWLTRTEDDNRVREEWEYANEIPNGG